MTGSGPAHPGAVEHDDLASLLFSGPQAALAVPSFAWGFGGLHGGLALSLVASAAQACLPGYPLRAIAGHFHQPVRERLTIESSVIRAGSSAGAVQAIGFGASGLCLTATATYGVDQAAVAPACAPPPPDVPGPDALAPLAGVDVKVPVLSQVEVRPVGSVEPFTGRAEPTMTAWMRVVGRDAPVDRSSIVFFLDALPPSYSAVLTEHRPVPTLDYAVHLAASEPTSPWVLVRSRTVRAGAGGWVTEDADAWDPHGNHLGSGRQLRLALAPRT